SVPRNIEPAVRDIDNAFLFDIDDLQLRVEQNREERLHEAEKAEQLVVDEVGVLRQWLKSLEVTPTIVALRNRTEDIKRTELEKAFARLNHLTNDDRQAVEIMASAMINKIVHGTMVTLKAEASGSGGVAFVEAARRFFSLDEGPSGNEGTDEHHRSAGHDLPSLESNSEEAPRRRAPRVRMGMTGRMGDRGDDPISE
ncbi:MAG: hypothetical protein ACREIM_08785, partial [Nitrospiraceae bacterium]